MDVHVLVLVATFTALFVSSIAGYGGSLILVPALGAVLGVKEGVALAALLLGWNNVFKVIAYRHTLALRRGWPLLVVTGGVRHHRHRQTVVGGYTLRMVGVWF